MAITWDPSDVPAVAAEVLAAAMRDLIGEGHGLVLLRGCLSPVEAAIAEESLHRVLGKEPSRELAALMRFRAMIAVFSSRRLNDLLLERGHEIIAPALQVAAGLRLNLKWGFNPQKFFRVLTALLDADGLGADVITRELLQAA